MYLYLSVVSIAKAPSSLRSPSIITSNHCRTISHSSLWPLRLSFNPRELRLRSILVYLGIQILPARVSITIFYKMIFCTNYLLNNKYEKSYSHLLFLNHFIQFKPTLPLTYNPLCKFNFKTSRTLKYNGIIICEKSIVLMSWMKYRLLLSGDVEKNPGPVDIALVTLNCRGLKKEHKFK